VNVVAVWTVKGGVGKTTAAVNLAYSASRDGLRTLVWDLDPQGAASFFLRIPPRLDGGAATVVKRSKDLGPHVRATEFDNLFLLPADFSYRRLDLELDGRKKATRRLADKLAPLAGRFDVVLLDCPPSVSLVTEAILRAADIVLAPVIPTTLSLRTLDQVRDFVRECGGSPPPRVVPYLSMLDRRKRLHLETTEACLRDPAFLRVAIPTASVVERMGVVRAPIGATLPSQPAARAFDALWLELKDRLDRPRRW
jgi:cellulose biosynthesis protein BcsQ